MALDPLKFKVAIQDDTKNALSEIEARLSKLRDVSIDIKVNGGNKLMFQVPDLSKFVEQLGDSQKVMNKMFANHSWQDLSSMKSAIEGLRAMKDATDKLAGADETASGKNTKYYENLERSVNNVKNALNDLPNLSNQSLPSFVKTLTSAISELNSSSGFGSLAQSAKKLVESLQGPLNTFKDISESAGGLKEFKTQIASIVSVITEQIRTIKTELENVKTAIQNDNFTAFKNRIESCASSLNTLSDAFVKFHMTIGKDESLRNFMEGLGEVIRRAKAQMATLDASVNLGDAPNSAELYLRNLKNVNDALTKIQSARQDVSGALTAKTAITQEDQTRLLSYFKQLKDFEDLLLRLRNDKDKLSMSIKMPEELGSVLSGSRQMTQYVEALTKVRMALGEIADMRTRLTEASQRGQGVVDVNGVKDAFQQLRDFERQLTSVGRLTGAGMLGADYKKLMSDAEASMQTMNTAIQNTNNYNRVLKDLEQLLNRVDTAGTNGLKLGVDTSKTDKALTDVQRLIDAMLVMDKSSFGNSHALDDIIAKWQEVKKEASLAAREQEKANSVAQRSQDKSAKDAAREQEKAAKDAKKQQDELAESSRRAAVEITKLQIRLRELNEQRNKAITLNVDTSHVDKAIAIVEDKIKQMKTILSNGGWSVPNALTGMSYMRGEQYQSDTYTAADEAKQQAAVIREAEHAKKSSTTATAQLSEEEKRLAKSIQDATNSASRQSSILGELKGMAQQYLSAYGAQQFVTSMAEITGELELQKKSLDVILDNASTAQNMYNQIRDLSQMSPYSFQDLLKSHRQLAAFGIEAKNIYGTMKALTDIGAGLDVDVSRLILAYGHTRSYGYLSGIQNRQFENAGIDMVGALSAKYNEQAEQAQREGRQATFTTRADVFKKMRAKEIPFADVEDVIMDLDKPGGKFYNMQIRQFETLGGKLRNLRNNYNIMMSEMGESNHGALASAVDTINDVTEHWRKYQIVIYAVVAALSAYKIAMMSVGRASNAMNNTISAMSRARQGDLARKDYLNGYSTLSNAVQYSESNPTASNNNVRAIARNKEINSLTKQRVALTGNLTQAQRAYLLISTGVNRQDAINIAQMGSFKRHLLAVKLGFIEAGIAAKSFMVAMMMNPATWIMAAIGAVTAFAQKSSQMKEQAENVGKSLKDNSETNAEGFKQTLKEYEGIMKERDKVEASYSTSGKTASLRLVDVDKAALEGRDLESMFSDIKEKLEKQSPMFEKDFFDINKFEKEKDQIEEGLNKLKRAQYVNNVVNQTSGRVENAVKEGGFSWYNPFSWGKGENYITNIKDYSDQYTDLLNSIKITDTEFDALQEDTKAKINGYVQSLGITRQEAISKYLLETKDKSVRELVDHFDIRSRAGAITTFSDVKANTNDSKRIAQQMTDVMISAFNNTDDMRAYFETTMNAMFSEAKIGDQTVIDHLSEQMMLAVVAAMRQMGQYKQADDFLRSYFEHSIGANLMAAVEGNVTPNTPVDNIDSIAAQQTQKALEAYKSKSGAFLEWYSKLGKESAKAFGDSLLTSARNYARKLAMRPEWQNRAIKMKMSPSLELDTDYIEYIKKIQKKIKEDAEKVLSQKQRFKMAFNIDLSFDIASNPSKLKKRLSDMVSKLNKSIHDLWLKHGKEKSGTDQFRQTKGQIDEFTNMRDYFLSLFNMVSYLDSEHQPIADPSKDKSKNKNGNGGKQWVDKEAKSMSEFLRLIKEMYDWYEKWEKKLGHSTALEKVKERYGQVVSELIKNNPVLQKAGLNAIDTLNNPVGTYDSNTKKVLDWAKKRDKTLKSDRKQANTEVIKTASNMREDYSYDNFGLVSDREKSRIDKILADVQKQFSLFSTIKSATGDEEIASRMSGLDRSKSTIGNLSEVIYGYLTQELGTFDKQKVASMSKDDVQTFVEDIVNGMSPEQKAIYQPKVAGLVGAVTDWQQLYSSSEGDDAKTLSNMISNLKDMSTELLKASEEYDNALQAISRQEQNGKITQTEAANLREVARAKYEGRTLEASGRYGKFMRSNYAMTVNSAEKVYSEIINNLNEQFKAGTISAKEYSEKIKSANDHMQGIKDGKSGVGAFLSGGLDEWLKNRKDKAEGDLTSAQEDYKTAEQKGDKAGMDSASDAMGKAVDALKGIGGKMAAIAKADKTIKQVNANVQSAKGLADDYADLLDYSGKGDDFRGSKAYGFIDGMSRSSQGISNAFNSLKSGDFAGVARGAIQSITGFYTGFADAHDKRLANKIEKLNEDVSKIEGYVQTISTARKRTLGYDDGSVIRKYQQQYNSYKQNHAAITAMRDYYNSAGGGDISGYQQEYNMLVQKRNDYIEMYNAEHAKKKKSESEMESQKQKIAELDDQIAYFAQDMENELWGIDVKSWSQQLSDALANAFENGENAAKAYADTVRSVVAQVISKMGTLKIIEPMMQSLQDELTAAFDPNNIQQSADKAVDIIAKHFGENGDMKGSIAAYQEFMNGIEAALNNQGMSLKNESQNTLSSSIQGTSEETSGLLAGYVNALRQDVSVNRMFITQFVGEYWPDYVDMVTQGTKSLSGIEQSVKVIQSAMVDGNGAMYEEIRMMRKKLDNVTVGAEKIYIK